MFDWAVHVNPIHLPHADINSNPIRYKSGRIHARNPEDSYLPYVFVGDDYHHVYINYALIASVFMPHIRMITLAGRNNLLLAGDKEIKHIDLLDGLFIYRDISEVYTALITIMCDELSELSLYNQTVLDDKVVTNIKRFDVLVAISNPNAALLEKVYADIKHHDLDFNCLDTIILEYDQISEEERIVDRFAYDYDFIQNSFKYPDHYLSFQDNRVNQNFEICSAQHLVQLLTTQLANDDFELFNELKASVLLQTKRLLAESERNKIKKRNLIANKPKKKKARK